MFQTKVVEKIKTHILCSITYFFKLCHLWDSVEKYYKVSRPHYKMVHAHCTLDT